MLLGDLDPAELAFIFSTLWSAHIVGGTCREYLALCIVVGLGDLHVLALATGQVAYLGAPLVIPFEKTSLKFWAQSNDRGDSCFVKVPKAELRFPPVQASLFATTTECFGKQKCSMLVWPDETMVSLFTFIDKKSRPKSSLSKPVLPSISPMAPHQYRSVVKNGGWLSIALRTAALVGFLLVTLILVVGVAGLTALSSIHSGFVAINGNKIMILGRSRSQSLLWTSLPTFILRVAAVYWDAIVAAHADRQPYVELSKGNACPKKSIMLDYRTRFLPLRWIAALRNKHFLTGVTMFLALVLSIAITPLSANMITPGIRVTETAGKVLVQTVYNDNSLNATMDWKPIYDRISSTSIYGGDSYPWTTTEYTFPAYTVLQASVDATVKSTGYSAELDCREIAQYDVSTRIISKASPRAGKLSISATDRGCDISQEFTVSTESRIYMYGSAKVDCSVASGDTRLVFTSGASSETSQTLLSNMSLISCIPKYSTTKGKLSFAFENTKDLTFQETESPVYGRPTNITVFEWNVFLGSAISFGQASEWSTNSFCSTILYMNKKKNEAKMLDPGFLQNSIKSLFTTVYLTATAMNSFSNLPTPSSVDAILSESQNRLFVVPWIAILTMLVLLACFVSTIFIWLSAKKATVLVEEPGGVTSSAALLYGGGVMHNLVKRVVEEPGYDGRFVEKADAMFELDEATCHVNNDGGDPKVDIYGLKRRESSRQMTVMHDTDLHASSIM